MADDMRPAGKTILCVDDDAGMLSALHRLLNPLGHRIITASAGELGIQLAGRERPDLIFLDVMMPGMSGLDVLRRLRELGLDETPVVMLTARVSSDAMMDGYREGAVYYITKPFRNEYVLNVVKYFLGDLEESERRLLEQKL